MDVQTPETPRRFSLRLDVYVPPQVLQTTGCVYHPPLPPVLLEPLQTAGPLRSTGITRLHRYCGPIRHPLAFSPLPGFAGYRAYLAPAIFALGRGGLLQLLSMSLSSCRRFHPAEVSQPHRSDFGCPCCLRPLGCGLGLRRFSFSRPHPRSSSLRPDNSHVSQ